jgi:hypothetical protein
MGNSLRRFSFFSVSRALRISVITHSLWMLCSEKEWRENPRRSAQSKLVPVNFQPPMV